MGESGGRPDRDEKRAVVLDATLRVMARDGLRAVTHRAVAKEMGASVRAATYYFASIEALIEGAFLHYVERALQRFEEVRGALPAELGAEAGAAALAAIVASDVDDDREGLVAEYTLVLEMSRRPALEPAYARWQAGLESMLRDYAAALGSDDPVLHARLVLATLRGLEIEALGRPSQRVDLADVASVFRALLDGLAFRQRGGERSGPRSS